MQSPLGFSGLQYKRRGGCPRAEEICTSWAQLGAESVTLPQGSWASAGVEQIRRGNGLWW